MASLFLGSSRGSFQILFLRRLSKLFAYSTTYTMQR